MPGMGSEASAVTSIIASRAAASLVVSRDPKVVVIPLAGGTDTAGAIAAWANPESGDIIVTSAELDIVDVAAAANAISVGEAANGTTKSHSLFDTLDVHSAAGIFNSIDDHGSLGKSKVLVPAGAYITVSTETGASSGLTGNLILHYISR